MKITYYENTEIAMRCIAIQLVEEFKKLRRIGKSTVVWTWNYHVPQHIVVQDLWKYLAETLHNCSDRHGICKAEIVYETHRSMDIHYVIDEDDLDACTTTGIKLTRVTDAQAATIEAENEKTRAE